MKTNLVILLLLLFAATCWSLLAGDAPGQSRASTPLQKPLAAKPACCAGENPAAPPAVGWPALSPANGSDPLAARSIYQLDAAWTDDAGRAATLTSLRGRPVIIAMFFASCEYACPILVQDMQRLRAAVPASVREQAQLVLVTFDTVRDGPVALQAFRARMALDGNWTLLRGEAGAVQELAMLLGVKFKQDARGQFAHSNLLTILNAGGEIVHQHAGLNGDISEAARAVARAAQ